MYGELHSPNYPEHYSAPLYKEWDLEVPLGYHIRLNFNYLNIKPSEGCRNDSLMVHVIFYDMILFYNVTIIHLLIFFLYEEITDLFQELFISYVSKFL